MRILVVGAGATGGYFGGRLAQAGRNVTFLVRQGRAEHLRADGLRIASPHGDVTLAPQLITADRLDRPYEAVLLTVKAYALPAALNDMAPAIGPDTMILPVLNGMRHVDVLVERFGERAVVGCVCKVATTIDDQGRIVQLAPFQELAYGERDGSPSERMQRLDAALKGAGFDARLSTDIMLEMWEKWLMLAAMGAITCLMRGTIDEVMAAPGGPAFIDTVFAEVLEIISAVGKRPRDAVTSAVRAMLTAAGSAQTSSMFRDLSKGQPIEADQIIGDLLQRRRQAGIEAPLLQAAYASLAIYQGRLAAK